MMFPWGEEVGTRLRAGVLPHEPDVLEQEGEADRGDQRGESRLVHRGR